MQELKAEQEILEDVQDRNQVMDLLTIIIIFGGGGILSLLWLIMLWNDGKLDWLRNIWLRIKSSRK